MRASSYLPLRKDRDKVLKYQACEHELTVSGIQHPVDIKGVGKFEHQDSIIVNIYRYEDKKIFPLFIIAITIVRDHMIYYISLLAKHLSKYWCKIWAD